MSLPTQNRIPVTRHTKGLDNPRLDFSEAGQLKALRVEARKVAAEAVAHYGAHNDSWIVGFSKAFSLELGEREWIGLTWPIEFGGGGRPAIERMIISEELIAAGAPIAASWFGDRQIGPSLIVYGTSDQRQRFLPGILAGRDTWCIGMSEPSAGTDLASIATRAVLDGGDYVINGQKTWTSGAALSDYCYLICRTGRGSKGHEGISEIVVPLSSPGVEIRPIRDVTGNTHFCEVSYVDVRVPAENLVGAEGGAFRQTMRQLEHERGGIDRLVSNLRAYRAALATANTSDPRVRQEITRLETGYRIGRLLVTREALGQAPSGFSAATKTFCTEHEQRVAAFIARTLGAEASLTSSVSTEVHYAPAYTIMGGTANVLRNVLAERVLGMPKEPQAW